MPQKLDKLGRRVPDFDRSAAAKKGAATAKKKYGNDFHSRNAARADHSGNRGYLGKLKDEGRIEELRSMARKGQSKSYNHFNRLKDEGKTRELKTISSKGGKAVRTKAARSGRNDTVSRGQ